MALLGFLLLQAGPLLGLTSALIMEWDRMNQVIRELKRQVAREKLAPEQLKGLIRAGYVYRNGDEHVLTDKGREALAQPGGYPREADQRSDGASKARGPLWFVSR